MALGGFASVPTGGLEVALFFKENQCGTGTPWAREAPHRLFQRVLPLLTRMSLPLTVRMVLRDQSAPARLQQDTYLGYAPLVDADGLHQQILLFRDDVASHTPTLSQQPPPRVHTGRGASRDNPVTQDLVTGFTSLQ
jgi:hypothetical protein